MRKLNTKGIPSLVVCKNMFKQIVLTPAKLQVNKDLKGAASATIGLFSLPAPLQKEMERLASEFSKSDLIMINQRINDSLTSFGSKRLQNLAIKRGFVVFLTS